MRISKKILACVLAALMAISMMPFTVLADEEVPEGATYSITTTAGVTTYKYDEFPSSLRDQGTYKLYTDVNAKSRMVPSTALSDITLDLNGHNFISTAEDYIFLFGGKVLGSKTFKIINTSSYTSYITGDANIGIGFDKSNVNFTLGENVVLNTNKTGIVLGDGKSSTSCKGSTVTINGTINAASGFGLTVNGTIQTADPAPKVIVNGAVNGSTAGIYAAGNADYTINGTVTGATGIYQKGGNLTVNDGAVVTGTGDKGAYVEDNDGMYSTGDAIVVEDNGSYALGTTTINGGTITSTDAGTSAVAEYDASSAASSAAVQDITVSGGTFVAAGAKDDISEYLIEGATQDANGVVAQTYVAKIGETYYETLNAALSAATAGNTITVLDDIVVTSPIVIAADDSIKLDLNGFSISGNIKDADGKKLIQVSGELEFVGNKGGYVYNTNTAGQGHAACQALTGGKITVNSPIHFGDSDTDMTNANTTNRGCGIQNNGGTLIINDGYYTAIDADYTAGAWAYAILNCSGDTTVNNATVYGNGLHGALGCESGTLTVNDGTFAVNGSTNYYSLYVDGGVTTVNGGTFTNNGKYGVNYLGTGAETNIKGGSFTYTVPFVVSGSKGNPVVTGGTFSGDVNAYCADGYVQASVPGAVALAGVAKINSTYYATLEDAIAAARTGEDKTVVVLDDIDLTSYEASARHYIDITGVTVDLNNHQIDVGTHWSVCFTGTNGKIMNGTCVGHDTPAYENYAYGIYVWGPGSGNVANSGGQHATITLENLTCNYGIHCWNADVTIKNCDVTGSDSYYAVWADENTHVTIESGNFTSNGSAVIGCAKSSDGDGNIRVNGGTFTVPAGKKLVLGSSSSSNPNNAKFYGGFVKKADTTVYTVLEANLGTNREQDMGTGEVVATAANTGASVTVAEEISQNFYIDADYYKATYGDDFHATITYNHASNVSEDPDIKTETIDFSKLPALDDPSSAFDGAKLLSVLQAPAQSTEPITIKIYDGDTEIVAEKIEYSVYEYCKAIIDDTTGNYTAARPLAEATLDYAAAAQNYFNYNTTVMATKDNGGNFYANVDSVDLTSVQGMVDRPVFITSATVVVKSELEINLLTKSDIESVSGSISATNGKENFAVTQSAKNGDYNVVHIKGIVPANMNNTITVTVNGSEFTLTANSIMKIMAKSADANMRTLAKAMYLYGQAADAYFV